MANRFTTQGPQLRPSFLKFFKVSLIAVLVLGVVFVLYSCNQNDSVDYSESSFVQLEEPSDDQTAVVFETTAGTFKAVLYEDEAPEYVEYFKGLVNDGYFDDTYVCTIIKSQEGLEAGFLGGSKTADGTTADDTDTDMTDVEISSDMLPIKGTLGSLVSESGLFTSAKAGSVITFVNDVVISDDLMGSVDGDDYDNNTNGLKTVTDLFLEYGGVPNLMEQYTLFGQVFDGWEAYDAICASEIVDEDEPDYDEDGNSNEDKNYQPVDEIKFTKVYLSTYGEEKTGEWSLPDKVEPTTISVDEDDSSDESDSSDEDDSANEDSDEQASTESDTDSSAE